MQERKWFFLARNKISNVRSWRLNFHIYKADVLYVQFKENAVSDDSELIKDDLIICYEGEEVAGITVLNASKRK